MTRVYSFFIYFLKRKKKYIFLLTLNWRFGVNIFIFILQFFFCGFRCCMREKNSHANPLYMRMNIIPYLTATVFIFNVNYNSRVNLHNLLTWRVIAGFYHPLHVLINPFKFTCHYPDILRRLVAILNLGDTKPLTILLQFMSFLLIVRSPKGYTTRKKT